MVWADNHANQRHLWTPHVFRSPYSPFSCRVATFNRLVYQYTHTYTSFRYTCLCTRIRKSVHSCAFEKARSSIRRRTPMRRSSQLPCRSKLSISIGYNDALVTIGYCGEPQPWVIRLVDLKGKKKLASTQRARTCMKIATATSACYAAPHRAYRREPSQIEFHPTFRERVIIYTRYKICGGYLWVRL